MNIDYQGNNEAQDVLRWALDKFHPDIALACSFQYTVLIHMMLEIRPEVKIFAIDTGRLPEETYQCAADVERRFGVNITWYTPRHEALQELLNEHGPFSFKKSVEARRSCCAVRKVEPMNRALKGLRAWITGVRRDQSATRQHARKIQVDDAHGGIIKVCPLADWTDHDVREYVKKYNLPYNPLIDQGYPSIGCACCTRPVQPGEDPRAGRWWWEESEHKECGLHIPNWQI